MGNSRREIVVPASDHPGENLGTPSAKAVRKKKKRLRAKKKSQRWEKLSLHDAERSARAGSSDLAPSKTPGAFRGKISVSLYECSQGVAYPHRTVKNARTKNRKSKN